ncbi:VanZ family protein [Ectothiorhodospira lacustris]|uniref:VanZ family protein n=1 Tax=Ectothiorhodospira lacustris TaxID=2899127 RepID=UPI001EE82650|nr:VanZ family protein [Ectothiorhodospira lacustris]MCG5510365.1 VanZ family protein [Ectothiorhodospira lacustris]MCG5522111.1 VanZ family protein [Ectothiorhodospira lacustris]
MSVRTKLILAAWLSLFGVLYATLMPFDFSDRSLGQAWDHYAGLTFPVMKASARQQWVANILLFWPLGLLWAAWLSGYARSMVGKWLVGVFVVLLALATTATVEFLQYWLPRREPSLLDMSGNFLGGLLGVLTWFALSARGKRWLDLLRQGGPLALWRGLLIYSVAYVLFAWLPLDFMISWQEVLNKLAGDHWGGWKAPVAEDMGSRGWVIGSMMVATCLPVGLMLGWWLVHRVPAASWVRLVMLSLPLAGMFGVLVELGQFMTVSGVAQGVTALLRTLGVVLGVMLFARRSSVTPDRLRHWARPLVWLGVLPYLVLTFVLNLGAGGFQVDVGSALSKLESLRFLPFWYHYMVPEAVAISSVFFHVVMYLPVGVGLWLWCWGPRGVTPAGRGLMAAGAAFCLALAMETGKLFMAGLRPDPTNVWIAAGAAWLGWQLLGWAWMGLKGVRLAPQRPASRSVADPSGHGPTSSRRSYGGFVRGE